MRDSPLSQWFASLSLSDPSTQMAWVRQSVGLHDATARDRLLVTGDDRLSFVQGLATNDVEDVPAGRSFEAAFINPKGRLIADVRVTKLDDALLMDMEPGRAEALAEWFGKYRIHELVEWADVSESLGQLELWGPQAAQALGEASLADGESRAVMVGEGAYLTAGTAFGAIVFVPAGAEADAATELLGRAEALGGGAVTAEVVEARRIELGLGRYGIDWGENTNPLEAGLDRALNYKKGCYVGQEVVAKATYIGHVNRRLVRLSWRGEPVEAGTTLLGGKAPGRVTSCARVPGTDEVVALGVVRRDAAAEGTVHHVGTDDGPEAVVRGYPYLSKEKPV